MCTCNIILIRGNFFQYNGLYAICNFGIDLLFLFFDFYLKSLDSPNILLQLQIG